MKVLSSPFADRKLGKETVSPVIKEQHTWAAEGWGWGWTILLDPVLPLKEF